MGLNQNSRPKLPPSSRMLDPDLSVRHHLWHWAPSAINEVTTAARQRHRNAPLKSNKLFLSHVHLQFPHGGGVSPGNFPKASGAELWSTWRHVRGDRSTGFALTTSSHCRSMAVLFTDTGPGSFPVQLHWSLRSYTRDDSGAYLLKLHGGGVVPCSGDSAASPGISLVGAAYEAPRAQYCPRTESLLAPYLSASWCSREATSCSSLSFSELHSMYWQ